MRFQKLLELFDKKLFDETPREKRREALDRWCLEHGRASLRLAQSVKELDERLAKVEKSASRGPVRTAVKAASSPNVVDAKAAKAAEYRAKASAANDPKLIEGYLLLAADAEK